MLKFKKIFNEKNTKGQENNNREMGLSDIQRKDIFSMVIYSIWCIIYGFGFGLGGAFLVIVFIGLFVLGIYAAIDYFGLPDFIWTGVFGLWIFVGFIITCIMSWGGIGYKMGEKFTKYKNHINQNFAFGFFTCIISIPSIVILWTIAHQIFQWTILSNAETLVNLSPRETIINALFGNGITAKIFLMLGIISPVIMVLVLILKDKPKK